MTKIGYFLLTQGNRYANSFILLAGFALSGAFFVLGVNYVAPAFSYALSLIHISYFSKRAAFEETLDLSAYGGEDGGEIKISYEYENKSSLELFTPKRYQEGQWLSLIHI